jgi:hypothetical protein
MELLHQVFTGVYRFYRREQDRDEFIIGGHPIMLTTDELR